VITVGNFNAALDRLADADGINPGAVIRLHNVRTWPGGKGVHVALAAAALREPVRVVSLVDAAHVQFFEEFLDAHHIEFQPVVISEDLRTNYAIRAGGVTTELLEPGPIVGEEVVAALRRAFLDSAAQSRLAVLSGSLPSGVDDRLYAELVGDLRSRGIAALIDASGERLRHACAARPTLVKPNREEAAALTGHPIVHRINALEAARNIAARGPESVVISLGANGLVALWAGQPFVVRVPEVTALNAVGAGDCLLGGLAVGLSRGLDPEATLRLGAACGCAKVLRDEIGMVSPRDINRMMPLVEIAVGD